MKRWCWIAAAALVACGPSHTPEPAPTPPAARPDTDAAPAQTPEEREAEQVAAIQWVVNQTGEAVHACYERATAERYALDGRVELAIEFGGVVPDVAVVTDEPGSAFLSRCLVSVFTEFPWPNVFDDGQQVVLPLSFVSAPAQYTVALGHVTVREPAPGLKVAVILDEDSTGNAAAALSALHVDRGAGAPLHRHTSAELLYVVEGGGSVFDAAGPKNAVEVTEGTAIFIPAGVPHGMTAGPDGVRAIQLYAPGGPEQRFEGDTDREDTTPVSDREARRIARKRRRKKPMTVALADVEAHELGGGAGSVAILFDEQRAGSDAAYLGVLTAGPGMKVPEHKHDASTEVLYVMQGEGTMTVAGEAHPVEAPMGAQIPPGTLHAFEVTSDEPVVAVQFYTPSGPEQRFVK